MEERSLNATIDDIILLDHERRSLENILAQPSWKKLFKVWFYPEEEVYASHALAKQSICGALDELSEIPLIVPGKFRIQLILDRCNTLRGAFKKTPRLVIFKKDDSKLLVNHEIKMPPANKIYNKESFVGELLNQLDNILDSNYEEVSNCQWVLDEADCRVYQWEVFFR